MPSETRTKAPLYAWVALAILMVVYLMYFLDKQVVALLANLIVADLGFTDVQLGLLQGFVYSIPYSISVLVAGWAADRFSRRGLLFTALVFWSICAAASGLATSFGGMAFVRVGFGLGAAFLMPCSFSIIANVFPRDRFASAMGIFSVGSCVGGITAVLLGSATIEALVRHGPMTFPLLGVLKPWQGAFVITGLPGVALAFLAWGIRDAPPPANADDPPAPVAAGPQQTLMQFVARHWRFLIAFSLTYALMTACIFSMVTWAAPYFGRTFHWSHVVIGQALALGAAAGGVGNVIWGLLADRLRRRGHADGVFKVFIPIVAIASPLAALGFLVKQPALSVAGFMVGSLVFNGFGSLISALSLASPAHLRGRLMGINLVLMAVIGLGLGPVLGGAIAQYVFGDRGKLGAGVAVSLVVCGWASLALLLWGRKYFLIAVRDQDVPAPEAA